MLSCISYHWMDPLLYIKCMLTTFRMPLEEAHELFLLDVVCNEGVPRRPPAAPFSLDGLCTLPGHSARKRTAPPAMGGGRSSCCRGAPAQSGGPR